MPNGISRNFFPWELKAEKLLERLRPNKLPTRRRQLPLRKSLASWAPQKPPQNSEWVENDARASVISNLGRARLFLQWTADKIFLPVSYSQCRLVHPKSFPTVELFVHCLLGPPLITRESHCPLETIASVVESSGYPGMEDDEIIRDIIASTIDISWEDDEQNSILFFDL